MANEFIARRGLIALESSQITGSLFVSGTSFFTGSVDISGGIENTHFIDFTTTASSAYQEGRINWIDDTKTLAIDTELNNFSIEVGHQNVVRVRNESGATILRGRAVFISGSSGNRPLIYTASYEIDPTSAGTVGLTVADISTSNNGYVISNGLIRDINTTAFTAGQVLYLSSSGQLTTTVPIAPLHGVRMGKVVTSAVSGIIHVDIDNGYEIGELHDIVDNTTSTTYGSLLVKSGSVWKDGYQLTGSYGLTGSLTATSFTGSLFGTASWALNVVGGGGGGGVTINNNVDNYLVTATGTTNTLNGESGLQYSSSILINTGKSQFGGASVLNTTHQFKSSGSDSYAGFLLLDPDGEETFKMAGSMANSDLLVSIGDVADAYNTTKITVDDPNSKITLEGKIYGDAYATNATTLAAVGTYDIGSRLATSWAAAGGPALTAGRIVYLSGSTQWDQAQANVSGSSYGMLGVVTDAESQNEVLIEGTIQISGSALSSGIAGQPVYLSAATAGEVTLTAPSTAGQISRIIGYVTKANSNIMYFRPDTSYIVVA